MKPVTGNSNWYQVINVAEKLIIYLLRIVWTNVSVWVHRPAQGSTGKSVVPDASLRILVTEVRQ